MITQLGSLGDRWSGWMGGDRALLGTGLLAALGMVLLRGTGLLQPLELQGLDALQRLRPAELADGRIVIVGVNEADLNWLGSPILTDGVLADVLQRVLAQQPRVIGLDFYRNIPVEPGQASLEAVLKTTPNLVGIEKVIGEEGQPHQGSVLPGNAILVAQERVAASDLLVDFDGRVRRGLVFPAANGPRILEGLGARVALDYLAAEGITPDPGSAILRFHLPRASPVELFPVERHTGGYVRADSGGYQILLNPRRTAQSIALISVRDLLTGNVAEDLMRDRIVMIGSTAPSSADLFYTSHSNRQFRTTGITYGVEVHAELASQILSQVLDGRPPLHSLAEAWEIALILALALGSVSLQQRLQPPLGDPLSGAIGLWAIGLAVPLVSYGSLVFYGLWLPMVPLLGTLMLTSIALGFNRSRQFKALSEKDGLTRLANRRIFDQTLQREWLRALRSPQPLSLIICDVDYFKRYNDSYGHAQGDDCLRRVARAIAESTSSSALAARYGGEEFVVLMPNSTTDQALACANQIRERLVSLQLPHRASNVADHVTISLGVASLIPTMEIPMGALVERADKGLYGAKQAGRNQAKVYDEPNL
ncbi:MAG: diguanylate cyclase [Synechococcales cyanobacterium RM1_1_8]|nr:diguanylate cyclase [Synechococcales cyanobacterium RM1_1_8]